MKKIWLLFLVGLAGCGLFPNPQPLASPVPTLAGGTPTATPFASAPTAVPGDINNPLILALAPAPRLDPNALNASKLLIAQLEKSSGYRFVAIAPTSETELIHRFQNGDAHIGVLSPFGYLLASEDGRLNAAFSRQQNGSTFYGAQFIVRSDAGFLPYFDMVKNENTADASTALAQFKNKKPCWSDAFSPSGYVVPLGFLNKAGVPITDPAFVAGQPTVVRAVYARGVCDFGATYIDARTYPGLEDPFPDVMKKVLVVWHTPNIIPYETLAFAGSLNNDMRRILIRAFVDTMDTPDGSSALQTLFGIAGMQVAQDGQYQDFRKMVKASGLDLKSLVK